jgi:hypothetical protein
MQGSFRQQANGPGIIHAAAGMLDSARIAERLVGREKERDVGAQDNR